MSLLWIQTGDGNLNIITNAGVRLVGPDHPKYQDILAGCQVGNESVADLLDELSRKVNDFDGVDFSVQHGELLFRGVPYENKVLSEKMIAMIEKGIKPAPLVRFLEKLEMNPAPRSKEMLWNFLEHNGFAISDDGNIIGFKYVMHIDDVQQDKKAVLLEKWPKILYTDAYSQRFNYTPGETPYIPRHNILLSEDGASCGTTGLHVGTYAYVKNQTHIILVSVDPMDVVSVPTSESQKMRVCRFKCLDKFNPEDMDEQGLKEPVMKIDGTKLSPSEYYVEAKANASSRPYVSDGDESEGEYCDNESASHWGK